MCAARGTRANREGCRVRTRALAQWIQMKHEDVLIESARVEAVKETARLIGVARASAGNAADAAGLDDKTKELRVNQAGRNVEAIPVRIDPQDVPTLEWCSRLAAKHVAASKAKVGKMEGLKEEILDRVKADPDTTGKRPPKPPQAGGPPS